ncbi:MAG: hypothetical protein Fur0037_04120 [Planctomycetota bacterium]
MTPRPCLPILAALAATAAALPSQQLRVTAPIGGAIVDSKDPAAADEGVAVEMLENPNLGRYLRKAQDFLSREQFDNAILVLQDVIEGRTTVEIDSGSSPGRAREGEGPAVPPGGGDRPPAGEPSRPDGSVQTLSAAKAVFSPDGRIYRPVRRLCQELLATMPESGLTLYLTRYDVPAAEALAAARKDGSISALERVVERFFVTRSAGEAMSLLVDRLLHAGRHRAAVRVARDLVEVYPPDLRRDAGISEVWARFKIALGIRLAGDAESARDAAMDLARRFPDESLRIEGELRTVKELAGSSLFGEPRADRKEAEQKGAPACEGNRLVPLWRFRFTDPEPYRKTQRRGEQQEIWAMDGQVANEAPYAYRYGVGTHVAFSGGSGIPSRALFLDHNRLEVADAFTGILSLEGDGAPKPPPPKDNQPRARVPAYDWATMRVIEDEKRYYAVQVYEDRYQNNLKPLKENSLSAYDKVSLARLWTSKDWLDGEDGLADATFLAAPTVAGERLLVPVLKSGTYCLQCLRRGTGRPLWRTPLHRGGSPFFRAPGTPVKVAGGIAYCLTNAGTVAAVDAFAGEIRWIRRYERRHPGRAVARTRRGSGNRTAKGNFGSSFAEAPLRSFLPSELVCSRGLVIAAPCDGFVLMCLDGSSGEVVWLLDQSCGFADFGEMQYIIGANSRNLYVATRSSVVCIGLLSGVRLWSREIPSKAGIDEEWRGRGLVLEDLVLMPNGREVAVLDADGKAPLRRLELPPFDIGPEAPSGPFNLTVAGPLLGAAYEGAIEVFASEQALRGLASASRSLRREASLLVAAGDTAAAMERIERGLAGGEFPEEDRAEASRTLLRLARERACSLASTDWAGAIAVLDGIEPFLSDRRMRMDWHVARLDAHRFAGRMREYTREQEKLYRLMEGRN